MKRICTLIAILLASGSLRAGAEPQQSHVNEVPVPGLPGVTVTAEPSMTQPEALRKCQSLKGYSNLQKDFTIEQAQQGAINRLDESLFTMLRTESGQNLNAAWWFNPIVGGKPQYDWSDFQTLFRMCPEFCGNRKAA